MGPGTWPADGTSLDRYRLEQTMIISFSMIYIEKKNFIAMPYSKRDQKKPDENPTPQRIQRILQKIIQENSACRVLKLHGLLTRGGSGKSGSHARVPARLVKLSKKDQDPTSVISGWVPRSHRI